MSALLLVVCSLGCSQDTYRAAVPLKPDWATVPPPPELLPPPPPPVSPFADLLPPPEEWDSWKRAPTKRVCTRGKDGKRRCRTVTASIPEQAQIGALVRATLRHSAGSNSAQFEYTLDAHQRHKKIYEVICAVKSPCSLFLPRGEVLAAPLLLNTSESDAESWDMGEAAVIGTREDRRQVLVLRPRSAPQTVFNTLLFASGLTIRIKLLAVEDGGMLGVSWTRPAAETPEVPVHERPPKLHVDRLFANYSVEVKGKEAPPWMPSAVLDDGSKTLIKFPEPLTYTAGPVVFGLTQRGGTQLVQSHMFVPPRPQPGAGAWLVVQGLHPALVLKDSAGMAVRLVRGDARVPSAPKGASHDMPESPALLRAASPALDRAAPRQRGRGRSPAEREPLRQQ